MGKIILGGGLSGLSAAYYLRKQSPKQAITLIEASSRTGGWIKSDVQKNGTIFEQGPRTIRPRGEPGANTLQLVEELNLSDKILPIVSSHPAAKNRMIYANGSLHLLPSSLLGLFKKQQLFSKPLIFHLLNDLTAEMKQVPDESIYDFIDRRFGREVADYLISPMICGICAGNAHEISVNFLMKQLFEYEQRYGSISGGALRNFFAKTKTAVSNSLTLRARKEKWSIYSFIDGCESLPIALRNNLSDNNVDIKLNTSCKAITFDKKVILHFNNNDTLSTDYLISSLPSEMLGGLLQEQHPQLGDSLKNLVKNVSVAVVNLHFKSDFLKDKGFGVLVAPKEKLPILGIIYDSCCFPIASGTSLTVMMGGHWFEEHFGKNPMEATLLETAVEQVKYILDVQEEPETHKVNILHQCLPQYIVGHGHILNEINGYIERHQLPLGLCGASYHGVGINDVILSAKRAVNKIE